MLLWVSQQARSWCIYISREPPLHHVEFFSLYILPGVSAKFLFVESKVTFSREYSYDGSYTFGEENSKSVAKTAGSTAAQLVKGLGPNAYLVYATMDKWTFAADNIAADYYGTCSYYNGDSEPVVIMIHLSVCLKSRSQSCQEWTASAPKDVFAFHILPFFS